MNNTYFIGTLVEKRCAKTRVLQKTKTVPLELKAKYVKSFVT